MHPDKFLGRDTAPPPEPIDQTEQLEKLSTLIADKRALAVSARKESGIEQIWVTCQESYLGIDDANRHEFSEAQWAKPNSINGPITREGVKGDNTKSSAFVRLTSRYVGNASAKMGEIILPIGDKAFSAKATPVPSLVKSLDDKSHVIDPMTQQPLMQQPTPVAGQPAAAPAPLTKADIAKQAIDDANAKAKLAETRIYDWMVESKYPSQARKVLDNAACLGAGVLKGPFPDSKTSRAVSKSDAGIAIQINQSIVPSVKWVDIWNIFPDESCGENIHDGDGIFERDYLSRKKLKELKSQTGLGYISEQIDKVIEEGPNKSNLEGGNPLEKKNDKRFEIWYYYGVITREDMACLNSKAAQDVPENQEDVNVIITMVNDTIIRAVINPLDSGAFPYHVVSWSRRPGHWAGVGVAELIDMPQKVTNAGTRSMLNNAGLSAGVQLVIDQAGITPADGKWTITPNKIWYKTQDSTNPDVRAAMQAILIPSMQQELMAIIQYGMKLAEESSGIPLVTQGQDGATSPQTFGQAELQNSNALTWLRGVGYRYDDMVTEPLIAQFYEYLLLDPSVPDEEKGDFQFDTQGSIAMVERAIQEQTLMQLLGASANMAFKLDPAKLMSEILKSKRMNPVLVQYTEEELQKMEQQQPQPAPVLQVAQIRAQTEIAKTDKVIAKDLQIAQMGNQTAQVRIKTDTDRDTVYVNAEMNRDAQNADLRNRELQMKLELAQLDYASKHSLKLEDVKAKLAETSMKLQVQSDLTAANLTADLHKHATPQVITPPTEPAGKADTGMAFSQ
jgi:hypothetical protein